MSTERIRNVVILGGGTAGWMCAALLSRTFANTVSITLVESDALGTVGVGEATIPPIQTFNRALKIDEAEFIRETNATIKLGIEFRDWGRIGDRYMHAFGELGHHHGLSPFIHYFLRGKAAGRDESLWDFSLNERAALAGKFGKLPRIDGTPLAGLNYAYHFDATLYAAYLRKLAEAGGVVRREGKVAKVERRAKDGFVARLLLEDESTIEGDLFVDCSGFRSLLIGDAMEVPFLDWSHWLPCDRALAVQSENIAQPKPFTVAKAHAAGWQWRIPLQHRTGNGHVYCSAAMGDDEAARVLLDNLEGPAIGEPRQLRFQTGRREKFWDRNVVAIGLSSGFLEPLESTSIHLIQSAVGKLAKLFPSADFDPSLEREFNRQMVSEFERIRDFIILHYHANERTDSDFWKDRAAMPVPETLTRRMELFRQSGRVFREEDDLFHEVAWNQVLIGQNIWPRTYDHMADALDEAEFNEFLDNLKIIMGGAVSRLPDHSQFLASLGAKLPEFA
ncbi:tryptophan 7-halogenase [Qipengyuania sp. 1NDH17]|uniref:Tryptophan 7-halogenase n=1 Tax=Qipengyuania polymorpha TaxID=2867234 RepID=A0ABS7J034_9SPHN|nr:tryptophan 7-halogenase [Qipengyuania polymorpha]